MFQVMPIMFPALYRISKEHWNQTIVALVYNVLKTFMEMNGKLFDELTSTYKGERLREKQREKDRDAFWKKMEALELNPPAEGKEVTPSLFPEKLTDYLKKVCDGIDWNRKRI